MALSLLALLVVLCFGGGATKAIEAVCPLKKLEAFIGEDVLLPCYTDPKINLSGSTLDWQRPDKGEIVFVYRKQKDEPQMKKYAYRMKVDHSALQWGILSLLIRSVGPSDSGIYQSYIPDYGCGCEVQLTAVNRSREVVSTVSPWTRAPPERSHADAASLQGATLFILLLLLLLW